MKNHSNINRVPGDNPIRNSQQDVLGRADVAKSFVRHVMALDASEGAVVGVLGPWGSGKTSFINLTRAEFQQEGIQMLDFNPWMFSGAEHLVERFFAELATQLEIHAGLKQVGDALKNYGEMFSGLAWVPLVGPWTDRVSTIMNLFGKLFKGGKGGIEEGRDKITQVLKNLKKPIIVVLDDVDRLSASEIRDIFKLVRLTASFPNIIYFVACDRFRVERALQEQGLSGRAYLEKIIQLPFDLPEVPSHILREQIDTYIRASFEGIENVSPLDEELWPDIFTEIVRPLIRNMRDVRRYVATVRGTVISLDGQVALADLFGLEAVRIFLPDVFKLMPDVIDCLTVPSASRTAERLTQNPFEEMVPPERNTWRREQVERLVEAGKSQRRVVQAMLNHLFPAGMQYINGDMPEQGDQWQDKLLVDCRVAHEDILRFYMERVIGGDLPAHYDAERAFAFMSDRNALDQFIRSLEPARWPDVIFHLSSFEFRREHVEPGIIVLFNLLPELPDNSQGQYPARKKPKGATLTWKQDLTTYQSNDYARRAIRRVALRLLSVGTNRAEMQDILRSVMSALKSLYAKKELVHLIRKEQNDDRLLSDAEIAEFEEKLVKEVQKMSADEVARECNLAWDLNFIKEIAKRLDIPFDIDQIDNAPEVTLAVFRSAISYVSSSESPSPRPGLKWDLLTNIYADETTLKARLECLQQWVETEPILSNDAHKVLELANQYLNG